jgi:MscS family membrane protein
MGWRAVLIFTAVGLSAIPGRPANADALPGVPGRPPANDAAEEPQEPPVDPGSPRAAVESYLALARSGDFDEAAKYLQVPKADVKRASELAERLRFVLERHDGAEVDELSAKPEGDVDDGLAEGVERIAVIKSSSGKDEDLLLKRVTTPEGKRWLFARDSVARVDAWYDDLEERWLLQHIPEPFRRGGPLGIQWWQWGAFVVLAAVAWLLGAILGRLTIHGLKLVFSKKRSEHPARVIARNRGPIALVWATIVCWLLLPLLDLFPGPEDTVRSILRLTGFVALFWALTAAADMYAANAAQSSWARRNPASKNLIPLGTRLLKVLVLAGAAVGLIAHLGFPVGSLIAGLGIGGLALALAGQKTIENLFGAVALAIDQPLREGDLVRVNEEVGTVEAIGLRSTRIRTLHRTVIAIPNGKLAEMTIESLAARDRRRFQCKIALAYDTRVDQVRRVVQEVRAILEAHPVVEEQSLDVHLVGYGESSLEIEIDAFIGTTVLAEFLDVRQELLLSFMGAVEASGTTLALPTQSLHVAADDRAGALLAPAHPITSPRTTAPDEEH